MQRFSWARHPALLAASAGLCFATSCSTKDAAPSGEPLGTAQQANVCAAGAVVYGIDVSEFQGNVDWGAVHGAGKDFAITRIGDGMYQDPTFDTNWAAIRANGMVRGAYQFFEPGEDPVAQANIVISKVGVLGAGDLPVTADVEVTGGQGGGTIAANLQTWIDHVKAGTGKTPLIYTAPGFWNGSVGSSGFGGDPLWVANWGVSCPSLPSGWGNWDFWQYADNGSVAGIGGAVDLDQFNGDLGKLQVYAGQADWAAQFVGQSWPYATTTITMTVNQQMPADLTMKNIGQKTWDSNTKLATTQPRDRMSPFVGPDWQAPNRLAVVNGTVPPGSDYKFQFTFQAPSTPGMYDEFFGMVQESAAWFSDGGQGGPPDNQLEAKIQVVEADYHAQFVSQTYPTLQQAPIMMTPGQTMDGTITLKNIGNQPWKAGETKLAPTPRDMPGQLAGPSWLSPTRVSSPTADVAPGGTYDFPLQLQAPMTPGDYTATFGLVEDGVTWFADAPKGGGPPDNQLAVHVVVGGASSSSNAVGSAGAGTTGAGGGPGAGGGAATGAGGSGGGMSDNAIHGKCSCRMAGSDESSTPLFSLVGAAFGIAIARKRRRRS